MPFKINVTLFLKEYSILPLFLFDNLFEFFIDNSHILYLKFKAS